VIEMIRMLYAVEKQARNVSAGERLALRQAESAPVLAQIRHKLLLWKEQLLPKHPMAEVALVFRPDHLIQNCDRIRPQAHCHAHW
jgi:hypothetical protein